MGEFMDKDNENALNDVQNEDVTVNEVAGENECIACLDDDPDVKGLLDSITEEVAVESAGEPENKPEEVTEDTGEKTGRGDVPEERGLKEEEPKDEADEEAAILAEVKSDRGKERIRKMLTDKKRLEEDQRVIVDIIRESNITEAEFAQTMEYNRLVASGDEKSLRVALDMLDAQRDMLCKRLGVSAPGVDLLSDFPDLRNAVDNLDITEERAAELANLRREKQREQKLMAQRQMDERNHQENVKRYNAAEQATRAFFMSRSNDVDYAAKAEMLRAYFAKPENYEAFFKTYEPEQWPAQFKLMYENFAVPKKQNVSSPQPLQSRPTNLGQANTALNDRDFLFNTMDQMGI